MCACLCVLCVLDSHFLNSGGRLGALGHRRFYHIEDHVSARECVPEGDEIGNHDVTKIVRDGKRKLSFKTVCEHCAVYHAYVNNRHENSHFNSPSAIRRIARKQ